MARSQIFVAISQEAIEAEQIHVEVQSAYQDFNFNSGPIIRDSASASQDCRGAHADTSTNPIPANREAWNSACLRFIDFDKEFQQRVAALRAAFAQIENVWAAEHHNQDVIVQASSDAAR